MARVAGAGAAWTLRRHRVAFCTSELSPATGEDGVLAGERVVAIPIAQFGSLSIMEAIVSEMDGFRPGGAQRCVPRRHGAVRQAGYEAVPASRRAHHAGHGSATELAVSGLLGSLAAWAAIADDGAGQVACRSTWFAPSPFTLSDPGYLVA
jgi:hypothetical protein